jgi:hypothetical protein
MVNPPSKFDRKRDGDGTLLQVCFVSTVNPPSKFDRTYTAWWSERRLLCLDGQPVEQVRSERSGFVLTVNPSSRFDHTIARAS